MRIVIGLSFLYCINALLDYPTACNCSEHLNDESCKSHNCKWTSNICEVEDCENRTITNCVRGSQFLSSHPKYCYIKDNKCMELTRCEDLLMSSTPILAREQCQLYQCAYDLVSGYCFKPTKCEDIYDDWTCNSFLIASNDPLSIKSVCYWDGKCRSRPSFIENCTTIEDQNICEQGGCFYDISAKQCKEIECQYRSLKDCNGEYVNNQGQVFICYENNDKCEEIQPTKLRKNVCNSMIGHTFHDKQCIRCDSYSNHTK